MKIGLQMISVKDRNAQDMCEVLDQIGEIGYQGVEFARGFYGKTVEEIQTVLDKWNMQAIGNHVYLELIEKDIQGHIDECKKLGMTYLVPLGGVSNHADDAEVDAYIERLMKLAEITTKQGVKLALHGSTPFYQRNAESVTLFERVLTRMPAEYMDAQVDTAWALCGGEDPAAWIRRWNGRIYTVHLKDFHPPVPTTGDIYDIKTEALTRDSAIGDNGVIDVANVLLAAKEVGTAWVIAEHMERPSYDDSAAAVAVSLKNIREEMKQLSL